METKRVPRAAMAALLVLGTASVCAAETDAARRDPSPRFGTTDQILTHVTFSEFRPFPSTTPYDGGAGGRFGIYSTTPNGVFWAGAHVPSGALLTYAELDSCDTSATASVQAVLWDCNYSGGACVALSNLESVGCALVAEDLTPKDYTMDNNARELVVTVVTGAGDGTTQLSGYYIGYKLQISKAPSDPTFGDVPTTHLYFRAIEALAASGITGGCGNGNYCPSQNVTRGEMAAFLARALGLHFPN